MKVTMLMENNTCDARYACAHGLSMYIETKKHKILFDMGPDGSFAENAEKLGVDLTKVDCAFLSHAHNDHCGGLETFLKLNTTAKVYLQKESFGDYYVVTSSKCNFIGLSPALHEYEERFVMCEGVTKIDEELTLFSGIKTHELLSEANATLREKIGEEYPRDTFRHEQNLLVCEDEKIVLFAGCAHNGIINILNRAEEIVGHAPDALFAGFHLYNPTLDESEPKALVDAVGEKLKERRIKRLMTGHCTGETAYDWLKEKLGERLSHMPAGSVFEV